MRADLPPPTHAQPRAKYSAAWALPATEPDPITTPQEPTTTAEGRSLATDGRMRSPWLPEHQIASGPSCPWVVMRYQMEGRARGRIDLGPFIWCPNPRRQDRTKRAVAAKHGRHPWPSLWPDATCELGTQAHPDKGRHLQDQTAHTQDAWQFLVGSSGLLGMASRYGEPGHPRSGDPPTHEHTQPSS